MNKVISYINHFRNSAIETHADGYKKTLDYHKIVHDYEVYLFGYLEEEFGPSQARDIFKALCDKELMKMWWCHTRDELGIGDPWGEACKIVKTFGDSKWFNSKKRNYVNKFYDLCLAIPKEEFCTFYRYCHSGIESIIFEVIFGSIELSYPSIEHYVDFIYKVPIGKNTNTIICSEFQSCPDQFSFIPESSGYYKWWCKKNDLALICEKLDIKLEDIIDEVEKRDSLYCIYVGQTVNFRKRFKNHILPNSKDITKRNQNSTLRRTIAALLQKDVDHYEVVDNFISCLYVEMFIHENATEDELDLLEYNAINEYYRILNVDGNNHKLSKKYGYKLKELKLKNKF